MKHINIIKILAVVFLFIFLGLQCNMVEAKRLPPQEVEPVIYNGVKYTATHEKMGYVEAWDIKTGEKLWEKKDYDVKIDPHMEADVQWVFITNLSIKDGKLIVVNENGDRYEIDIESTDTSQTDSNTVSKNNLGILSAIFVVLLFIGGYLRVNFAQKRFNLFCATF